MRFTCKVGTLAAEIGLLAPVASRKTSIAIHNHILVQATPGGLVLTATDIESTLRVCLTAEVAASGKVALEAKRLAGIISSYDPAATVTFVGEDGYWVVITCGASKIRIPGLDPDDFPKIEEMGGATAWVPAPLLIELLRRSLFAAEMKDQNWSGSLLTVDGGKATMSATNGHRMSRVILPGGTGAIEVVAGQQSLSFLAKALALGSGDVALTRDDTRAWVSIGPRVLTMKIDERRFPNLANPIKHSLAGSTEPILIDRKALMRAIDRAAIVSADRDGARPVKLRIEADRLEVRSGDGDGQAEDAIPVDYTGEPYESAYSSRYLRDFLATATAERVLLRINKKDTAGVIEDAFEGEGEKPEHIYLVMGMRL